MLADVVATILFRIKTTSHNMVHFYHHFVNQFQLSTSVDMWCTMPLAIPTKSMLRRCHKKIDLVFKFAIYPCCYQCHIHILRSAHLNSNIFCVNLQQKICITPPLSHMVLPLDVVCCVDHGKISNASSLMSF